MISTRRGRSHISTRVEITAFVSVTVVSLYILPRYLKVLLAIILLTDTFVLPRPLLHLFWLEFIQPTTSLVLQGIRSLLGLLAIFSANAWDWLTRNRSAGNVALDSASYINPTFSEFFARHPNWSFWFYQWSPTQRTPAFAWICVSYALYYVFSSGFSAWGMILGMAICAFALTGVSLILTLGSSIASLYYGITSTYRGYLDKLSDWREGVLVAGGTETGRQVSQPFWTRTFKSKNLKVSKVIPQTDDQSISRVTEPSLIDVFLPLNPFTTTSTTTTTTNLVSEYAEKVSYLISRVSARKAITVCTVPEPQALETGPLPAQETQATIKEAMPTQGTTKTSSRWKFWVRESTPASKNLPSEDEIRQKIKSKVQEWGHSLDVTQDGSKTLASFANEAMTAASTQESKIIEGFLSITDVTTSKKSEIAAEISISKEAKAKSIPEQKVESKASKDATKRLSSEEKAKAQASKATVNISIAVDKARSQSIKEAEKISSAEATNSIAREAEDEMNSRAAVKAKSLESSSLSAEAISTSIAMEKEAEMIVSATSKGKSPTVGDDTEGESRRYAPHDKVIENFPAPIKPRTGFFSSIWTTEEPAQKIVKYVDSETSSGKPVGHLVSDKIVEQATKVTKIISAKVTDIVTDTYHHRAEVPFAEDSYVKQFVNTIIWMISSGVFGTLGFFLSILPRSIGPTAIPLDGYSAEPTGQDLRYCGNCSKTALLYTLIIGLGILTAPSIRSVIFRSKIKPPTLISASIALMVWTPSIMCFIGGLVYRSRFELEDILQPFRGNLYFLAFVLLATAKISRTMINAFSYHLLSHPEPAHAIQISPQQVTVILPYTFRTNEPGRNFEHCIESILQNHVKNVVLLVHDVDTCVAAEQFAMRYSTYFTLSVFMSVACDERTRFIECGRRQHTPITIFVEKGTAFWGPKFLRAALQPFEDLKTALVAPAFHTYTRAADDIDVLPADLDEMLTPPNTPPSAQDNSMTPHRIPHPTTHTLTQTFLLHLAKVQISRYNFSNTATYNLDGFTTPLSQHTLLIRTDILHTAAFQAHYLRHPNPTTSITQWVQSKGLQTVFLNTRVPQTYLCIQPEQAETTLFSFATTTLLESRRLRARYSIDALLQYTNTYRQYPWSTFAIHVFNLVDIPLLYDSLLFYTMRNGVSSVGNGMICQLVLTLVVLKILERLGVTVERGLWYKPSNEFWGFLLPVLVWEYVVESVVGVWGLVTCFGEERERAMDAE